jgi:hypothetical protein
MLDQIHAAHITTLLLILGEAPDGTHCSPPAIVSTHSGSQVLFHLLIEMKTKFGFKLAVHGAAA